MLCLVNHQSRIQFLKIRVGFGRLFACSKDFLDEIRLDLLAKV